MGLTSRCINSFREIPVVYSNPDGFDKSADALKINKHYHGQDWHFWDRLRVSQTRGTDVRLSVAQDNFDTFASLMPLIFSDQQKQSLFNILKGGINENA